MPRRRNRPKAAEGDARELTLRLKAFRQWIAASREAAQLDDFFRTRRWNARYAAQASKSQKEYIAKKAAEEAAIASRRDEASRYERMLQARLRGAD